MKQALISAQAPGRQRNFQHKNSQMGTKNVVRKGPITVQTSNLTAPKTFVGIQSPPPFTFQEVQVHQKGSVDLSAVRHIK